MTKIAFYFQNLNEVVSAEDDLEALIELHVKSFERFGWQCVKVDERDAQAHPEYERFNDPNSILGRSMNPWEYTRACYMRWLAYASVGHPYADFDVINYGFTPDDAEKIRESSVYESPIFLAQSGAMGLFGPEDYKKIIDTYLQFMETPVIEGPLLHDINDMTIMRHLRIDWYNSVAYEDVRFVKDYTNPLWEEASLVHYPYSVTPLPRVKTINSARPPLP